MSLASATTDVLRTKGMPAYQEFVLLNVEQIHKLKKNLAEDRTNFNAFGEDRRELMLLEYSTGLVYYSSLTEEEQNGIAVVAQRQYEKNIQVMASWVVGGFVCVALLVALITGNSENKEDSKQSQIISAAIAEVIV